MSIIPNDDESAKRMTYDRLRQAYDAAFRKLVVQTRYRQQLIAGTRTDGRGIAHVNARIERTAGAVRYRRDMLADFLLKPPKNREILHSRIQEAAYFIWLNAGRPGGTSASDWINAQRQFAGV